MNIFNNIGNFLSSLILLPTSLFPSLYLHVPIFVIFYIILLENYRTKYHTINTKTIFLLLLYSLGFIILVNLAIFFIVESIMTISLFYRIIILNEKFNIG
jgi:hypothetical protein